VGDPDVFDTWATSALTPLIPSGWPKDMERHQNVYPNDLRPQSHEIIRTWAFVTITRSYLEDGSIPWNDVAISGWILDPDRKKMSKSKGNVVLPTELLDEYGSDAVRYWAASARLGVDTAFDSNVLKEGRRLITKMQNAARLIRGYEGEAGTPSHPLDLSFLARTRDAVQRATDLWESWDHAGALHALETWFWAELCDNYLELSKGRAYAGDPSAIGTLRTALDLALRLFAPYVPFITEELYNVERDEYSSVHRARWPQSDEIDSTSDDGCFAAAVSVVTQVRKKKSDAKVSLRYPVTKLTVRGPHPTIDVLNSVIDDVMSTVNATEHELIGNEGLDELEVHVDLADEPEPSRK
jgi:valyl-tRNA synthetase